MISLPTPRIIGFAGWSGAGKTTLITKLIPELKAQGFSVSTIKHAHHGFDVDTKGKDSYLHREAGASEVLVASNKRFALLHEFEGEPMSLMGMLGKLAPVDFVLVEGFKTAQIPKIEVYREANNKPLIALGDANVIAIAGQGDVEVTHITIVDIDDISAVAKLVKLHAIQLNRIVI
jgi:molybdopterin-guanine dinucleotide biosynthesis adapter protein